jgi:YHS domain-containing protein/ElaB/YqjD/DUF883 family membrane-anchored ribosome-binding protein
VQSRRKEDFTMGKDPVCREEVDERSGWSSVYQDKIYYFNSAECKADFDSNPGMYVSAETIGTGSGAGTEYQAETGRLSSRARTKIESMISERKSTAADRIGSVSNAFRSVSQQLREQKQDTIAQYADRAAENVDRISGYLQQRNADEIISDTEDFLRRRPGWMIGGALAAGFLMARFLKSSRPVPVT